VEKNEETLINREKVNKPFVRSVYSIGHADLNAGHLAYVPEMANRVGFRVIEARPDLSPYAFTIELKISMTNPIFVAELEADATTDT
jgi:hypothetical protein